MNVSTPASAARPAPLVRTREYETIYILRSDVDADTAEKVQHRVAEAVEPRARQAREGRGLGPPQAGVPGRQAAQGRLRLREVRGRGRPRGRGRAQPEAAGRRHEVHDRADERRGRPRRRSRSTRRRSKLGKLELPAEPEPEESREKQLGLIDPGPDAPRSTRRPRTRSSRTTRRASAATAIAATAPRQSTRPPTRRSPKAERRLSHGDDGRRQGHQPRSGPQRRRSAAAAGKKRVCKYCTDKTLVIDYKDPQALKYFITERGKVVPRRISGNCARHQRKVQLAVKRARNIALLPFTVTH